MGDRSLIVIEDNTSNLKIVMYGHWSGTDNLQAVQNVLATTSRVGDHYLVAEIFHEFSVVLGGYAGIGSNGFGIWSALEGFDEGWTDSPTIYLNVDTGNYKYDGVDYHYKANTAEPDVVYGGKE